LKNFIASTDWRPIEQTIRVDLNVDVREYAARIKTPTLLITAKHDQIVPPAYSENLVPNAKTIELNSGHLIFLEKPVEVASAILSFFQSKQVSSLKIIPGAARSGSLRETGQSRSCRLLQY
jgi:3-oxoadipate enol-lactonase